MLAAAVRSGLEETHHDGAVAVIGSDGELIAWSGDIDRPFYIRSAAKPFQALISQNEGALLRPVELALAAASHDGDPVHVGIVESMLESAGLSITDLQCPAEWPQGASARMRRLKERHHQPRPTWHNCSGKHAAWLRACRAQGWDTSTYLRPDHPLQVRIANLLSELGSYKTGPVGIDGCGAPVHRTTVRAMASMYARFGSDREMKPVFTAMHRYPALVSGTNRGDTAIATALNAVAKGGAAGCIGVAVEQSHGMAVKAWDGARAVAETGAVAVLDALGLLVGASHEHLEPHARPPVIGGGRVVGRLEPRLELRSA